METTNFGVLQQLKHGAPKRTLPWVTHRWRLGGIIRHKAPRNTVSTQYKDRCRERSIYSYSALEPGFERTNTSTEDKVTNIVTTTKNLKNPRHPFSDQSYLPIDNRHPIITRTQSNSTAVYLANAPRFNSCKSNQNFSVIKALPRRN